MNEQLSNFVDLISNDKLTDAKSALHNAIAEFITSENTITESTEIDTDGKKEQLLDLYTSDDKKSMDIWNDLETYTADSGVYHADATPDELFDIISDTQIDSMYLKYLGD